MLYGQNLLKNNNINIHLCDGKASLPHSHDFLELAYVVSGNAVHILNNTKSIITKGDYFILDYNSEHSYYSLNDSELIIVNCLFKPDFIDSSLSKCRNFSEVVNNYMIKHSLSATNISPANYIFNDEDNKIYELLMCMLDEFNGRQAGYYEIIRCRLIEIIILTMRKSSVKSASFSDELCLEMLKYAEKHITDKNILSKISSELNFSPAYLSKKFKNEYGTTFSSYIQKIRIEQSCRLLANTNKKITEIASLSGYSDMKFFNSVFKKYLGVTPREFRRGL